MINKGNGLWLLVAILAILAYPLYYNIKLVGINRVLPSIDQERCLKIDYPEELACCEDITLSEGVIYASCDPAREKVNKILGYNFYEENEVIPSGNIWKIDHTVSPPVVKSLATRARPTDFHPLGMTVDSKRKLVFAISLPLDSDEPSIEVFSIEDEDTLVHRRSLKHSNIYNPNSIHIVDDPAFQGTDGVPSFFFSNDHYFQQSTLKLIETSAILPISGVMFYDARTNDAFPVINGLSFANGVAGDDSTLFVSECGKMRVHKYSVTLRPDEKNPKKMVQLEPVQKLNLDMAVDNVDYDAKTGKLVIAGHPKGLDLMKFATASNRSLPSVPRPASLVVTWIPASNEVKTVFSDDGHYYGASTTGILDEKHNKLIVSSLFARGILVCDA